MSGFSVPSPYGEVPAPKPPGEEPVAKLETPADQHEGLVGHRHGHGDEQPCGVGEAEEVAVSEGVLAQGEGGGEQGRVQDELLDHPFREVVRRYVDPGRLVHRCTALQ